MIKKSIFILIATFLFTACVERGDIVTAPKHISHVVKLDPNVSSENNRGIPTLVVRHKKPTSTVANKLSGSLVLLIGIALLF